MIEMFRCMLADFVVEFRNRYPYLEDFCADYRYDGTVPSDFVVAVSDEDMSRERHMATQRLDDGYVESVCAYRKLCYQLPQRDAMFLHASVISFEGRGIAFLAKSGVGKTTHTKLWKNVYGEKVSIINGDKPIIRFWDGVPYAYGTPWAGKENLQMRDRVELRDICFIRRSEYNSTNLVPTQSAVAELLGQILLPPVPRIAFKTLDLLDLLTKHCRLWEISCNMTKDAAKIACETILAENLDY